MAVATVVKTIGTTGVFSTLQLWEDGAPASLTTAEKSAAGTFLVASFIQGETLNFSGSLATGKFLDTDSTGPGTGSYITYGLTAGDPGTGNTVTGATSLATCVLSSGTPTDVGVIWQGQCQNQEFSGTGVQLTIAGSTASATAYKELTAVAGTSFRDHADKATNALRYNASNGAAIRGTSADTDTVSISNNHARVSKLQIAATGAGGRALLANAAPVLLDFLILEGMYVGTSPAIGVLGAESTTTIRNSAIILRASAADHIIGTGDANTFFYNCTIAASDDLATAPASVFRSTANGFSTITVKNCGLFAGDSTKAIKSGADTFVFTTCYSDISGTLGVTQATYSSEFENVTDASRDFRLKSTAAQVNTGTTDSTNAANDIIGTARPQGAAYDVGCWEYASPQSVVPLLMSQYRRRWGA